MTRKGRSLLTIAGLLALLAVMAFLDYVTGREYGFDFVYLIAVALAAWLIGFVPALLIAALATVAWLGADDPARRHDIAAHVWNATSTAGIFVGVAYLVTRERARIEAMRTDPERAFRVAWLVARERARSEATKDEGNRLFRLAVTDEATRLYSRDLLFDQGRRTVAVAGRSSRPCSIVTLSLDFGRGTPDSSIQAAARIMRGALRDGDLAARLSHNTFATLLPNTSAPEAQRVVASIQEAVLDSSDVLQGVRPKVGFSTWLPGRSFEDMVAEATTGAH